MAEFGLKLGTAWFCIMIFSWYYIGLKKKKIDMCLQLQEELK